MMIIKGFMVISERKIDGRHKGGLWTHVKHPAAFFGLAWKKVKTHMLCTELPELPICFVAEKKTAGLNICPKNLFDRPS